MKTIKRALISCTDKTGIVEFAKFLQTQNIEILSTGGTAKILQQNNIAVIEVSDFTQFPEMLDGRVKTLHPKIYGGILNIRDNKNHQQQIVENKILPIDLVVVNLYAFEQTIAKPNCSFEDAIENIDIGGPSMLRAAAKNYQDVIVVVDPQDYQNIQNDIIKSGTVSLEQRLALALKVFQTTANYDIAIQNFLHQKVHSAATAVLPQKLMLSFEKQQDLRYGENPHQQAAFYQENTAHKHGITQAQQLQGKELSFNNILDTDAAHAICCEFEKPACVIVKHNNPCGVAVGADLVEAFQKARSTDPVSSFGGIIAVNRMIDENLARVIAETFFEVILAPEVSPAAQNIFAKKKNLRVLVLPSSHQKQINNLDYRRVSGGLLVQEKDAIFINLAECQIPTIRKPSPAEIQNLDFAWRVAKHVKSNAIVFAKNEQTLGIGAGQMSRVDSVKIAQIKSEQAFPGQSILKDAAMASDAFFPFRDGLEEAAKAGITSVIQPGGSVKDEDVIAAANEYKIAMIFTGQRHFKH